ncbi:MAG: aromatic amino acid transport family protein [Candidatus Malihini olakiniferum]
MSATQANFWRAVYISRAAIFSHLGNDDSRRRKAALLKLLLQKKLTFRAFPVVLTSFGFHGSISQYCSLHGSNSRKLRLIFIIGNAVLYSCICSVGSVATGDVLRV